MKTRIARHPVLTFYFLAYACSWSIGVPLALQAQDLIHTRLPLSLHYLTAFGPAAAAFVVSRVLRGAGRKVPPSNLVKTDRRFRWMAIGVLSPCVLFLLARFAGVLIGRPTPGWIALGQVNFLPDLGLAAWLLWFVTSGLGEEIGWRGFALPRLQGNHSALASSGLLAVAGAGWHLPAFFYVPSYLAMGFRILPGFFIGVLAGSIVLTWLYNNSGGSVLAVVLWHASFNYVTASPNATGVAAAVTSALVIVWAVAIVWLCDSATFTIRRVRSIRPDGLERAEQLPGDDLISEPIGFVTHAITIRRGPREVWRWLAQMGAGRVGWYSYDALDNGGSASADCIRPDLQDISVGTVMPALPGAKDGFVVARFEPERSLILGWPGPGGGYLTTWTFVLQRRDPDSTRLIVRARAAQGYRLFGLPTWLGMIPARVVHFVMERKQLLGIARRAEARA